MGINSKRKQNRMGMTKEEEKNHEIGFIITTHVRMRVNNQTELNIPSQLYSCVMLFRNDVRN